MEEQMKEFGIDLAPVVYANNTSIDISNWDVSLVFGVIEGTTDEKMWMRRAARVIVSLQHAKAVCRILAQQLARFEEKYGEIREFDVPDENFCDPG